MVPIRIMVGVALGLLLVVVGFGSTGLALELNQQCHERWDGVEDAYADCEDAVHGAMLWGGALFGTFGLALLAAAGYERRSAAPDDRPGHPS